MHSSRMRTVRSSSRLLGGGAVSVRGGVCLGGCMSAQGGLPGGVSALGPRGVYPSMQQTPVKT